ANPYTSAGGTCRRRAISSMAPGLTHPTADCTASIAGSRWCRRSRWLLTTRPGASISKASGIAEAITLFSSAVASAPISLRSTGPSRRCLPTSDFRFPTQLLDPNRRRLEFRRARLRVPRLDGQAVHVHLVRMVDRHERQARPHLRVDADRCGDARPPGDDFHHLAVDDTQPVGVLGGDIEGGADPERGVEAARLNSRVVPVEMAPGGEPDRVLVRERVDGWHPIDRDERGGVLDMVL